MGACSKVPWKLNRTRRANLRLRVAGVKEVLETLRAATPIKALVRGAVHTIQRTARRA